MVMAADDNPFASESSWPFTLHQADLAAASDFLTQPCGAARVLRIFGSSGAGKSFMVRELMTRLATGDKHEVGLYADVPPGDLEASAWPDRLGALMGAPRTPTRDMPSFVGKRAAKAWASASSGAPSRSATYGYQASRELSGQIPLVGPFVKGLIPQAVPVRSAGEDGAPLRFLMRRSRDHPVVLAIDNVQFLPFAVREMLDAELSTAGRHLRLILIERTRSGQRLDWQPPVPGARTSDVELGRVSSRDVADLIAAVMPDAAGDDGLAASVLRRSDGNLKSVWFQLRLIASRRADQEATAASYGDVISTLAPLDQTVLRFVVFTIGGLTVATLGALLQAKSLRVAPDRVSSAITDLVSLGLIVVNGDRFDRVRVEHELVAQVVSELTPEEEKLELRTEAVAALSSLLETSEVPSDEAVLYDRLLGIVNEAELRQEPALMAHVVRYVQLQAERDNHRYLASICKDSVCWDVLDDLPDITVRSLLDAIQKSSLFSFGLVTTSRLRNGPGRHEALASLYEAKYLVQLFQYDEAQQALDRAMDSKEKRAVAFNMMLILGQDDEAAEIAMEVFADVSQATGSEHEYVILRNSGHLFPAGDASAIIDAALDGFARLGRPFGYASTLNNRGVIELVDDRLAAARTTLAVAHQLLAEIQSVEAYQPLVNLSALSLIEGDLPAARRLLEEAREAVPRSLIQDDAMFEHNQVVLDLCDGTCSAAQAAERMERVVQLARKTRDLRFIDAVCWLGDATVLVRDGRPLSDNRFKRAIDAIRVSHRLPIESFVPARVGGIDLEVPFVLSPNWRY
jgi:tetratricopeptide (TPR) repeat protein